MGSYDIYMWYSTYSDWSFENTVIIEWLLPWQFLCSSREVYGVLEEWIFKLPVLFYRWKENGVEISTKVSW